ncbi:MFS transporter [Roseibium sp. MMSF_3544]|uniref:MFS transporter n=1 Tax=unclassified Roseibium TaxID=2629323 RepID=UPI00273E4DC7|nr:MFS transporter [Roseibium sp. MMSF_3544]
MNLITEQNRKWWLLGAVSCVLGLVLLDETVVGIALPSIQKTFGLSNNTAHWIVNAYLLTLACFVAVGGKLGDLFGVLRMFLLGLGSFGVFSVICGFAPTGEVLIIARALQGLGAAVMFPLFMAMVTMTFPKEQHGTALAVSGSVGTIFLSLGPLVGGLFTDLLTWRWIFWINPFLVVGIGFVVTMTWRDVEHPPGRRIDWTGLVLIASGMFCLVFALMEADDWGWHSLATWLFLVLGFVLLGIFCWYETTIATPLIKVDLFANPVFSASNVNLFMAQYAKMPIFVFVALYAQTELKLSAIAAGLLVMLTPIPQPFVAAYCGRLVGKVHPRKLAFFGLVLLFSCLLWLFFTTPLNNAFIFAPGLLVAGAAFPFLFVPSRAAIMGSLPEYKHGQGSGIAMASQMIGGTVGLSASSAAFAVAGYQGVLGLAALLIALAFVYALFAYREV